ncbi:MAG: homoserine kinase [Myxococcota bacterium]
MTSVTAFAPATVANVAVGFDLLGFACDAVGDRVTVSLRSGSDDIVIEEITGVATSLPRDAARNTASVALRALQADRKLAHGFRLRIDKGIALSSGMGGSAASAVAAVVAADRLLGLGLTKSQLVSYALAGEEAASGARHADNVAPCVYGGLTAVVSHEPLQILEIPVPTALCCALVHPHAQVETAAARALLRREVKLTDHVQQSARLAGFLAGCFQGNLALIHASMQDLIIEPQRQHLVAGFAEVKQAALAAGALGCSLSGSGPSVFAWADSRVSAERVKAAMVAAMAPHHAGVDAYVAQVHSVGAHVVE